MRWVAFYSRSKDSAERLFVAPFANGDPIPQDAWIPVTDGKTSDNKPRWSPDGNLIYFTSDRNGGESIWAQRLDPSTKKPRGEPFQVEQLRRGLLTRVEGGQGDLSVARDRLIFSFAEVRSNLWKTRIPQ